MKIKTVKQSKAALWIAYLFLLLPFLIFAIGWFGKRYWIPILPILLFCYWKAVRESEALWIPEFNKDNVIKICFIIAIVFIWVYYSGIGRMVYQNIDHNCRNAIFDVLVQKEWPIINHEIIGANLDNGITATSLIYYIGFWLPSAVVGKIWGLDAGYGFQVFWAFLGILLVYYFICARKEKLLVWPLAILIFFSGLDIVGQYLRGVDMSSLANDAHLEWWVEPYQYSSMTTQLFWVFNQAIPAWLCTILAYIQKNNRSLVFILATCMLPGTFPFVGLLFLVLYWILTRKYNLEQGINNREKVKKYFNALLKDTFTVQNFLGGGIVGIFSFIYLIANFSGNQVMQKSVFGATYENHLAKYIMFILVEVGIYFILIYRYQKKNSLYYAILACLLVIPPIKVGFAGDFCMRVSIPALFLLMILVMDTLERAMADRNKRVFIGLIAALCIGGITPLHEITRTFENTAERLNTETQLYESSISEQSLLNSNNFSGAVNDSFFFKYIAR